MKGVGTLEIWHKNLEIDTPGVTFFKIVRGCACLTSKIGLSLLYTNFTKITQYYVYFHMRKYTRKYVSPNGEIQ